MKSEPGAIATGSSWSRRLWVTGNKPGRYRSRSDIPARVAQLTERWSYKPEVEGLSPSLGTKQFRILNCGFGIGTKCEGIREIRNSHFAIRNSYRVRGPRSRHRSSKPNLKSWAERHEVQLLRGLPRSRARVAICRFKFWHKAS